MKRTQINRLCRRRFGACQRRSGRVVTYQSRSGVPGLPEATSVQHMEAKSSGVTHHFLCCTSGVPGALELDRVFIIFLTTAPESCAGALQISAGAGDGTWPGPCPCLRPRPALSGLLPGSSLIHARLSTGTQETRIEKSLYTHHSSYQLTLRSPPPHPSHTLAPRLPSSSVIRVRFRVADRKYVREKRAARSSAAVDGTSSGMNSKPCRSQRSSQSCSTATQPTMSMTSTTSRRAASPLDGTAHRSR